MSEEDIRADERRKCWLQINRWIIPGDLPGNGCDRSAQRNGLILAANIILGDGFDAPLPPVEYDA